MMKCFKCSNSCDNCYGQGEYQRHTLESYTAYWGMKSFELADVDCYRCANCEHVIFTGEQARVIEKRRDMEIKKQEGN